MKQSEKHIPSPMTNHQLYQKGIQDWIRQRKGRDILPAADQPLDDLLDSVDFLELLLMIEEHFSVHVNPFEVSRRDLGSVQRIAGFLAARKAGI